MARFDEAAVDRIVREAGLPAWSRTRPSVLTWVAVGARGNARMAGSEGPGTSWKSCGAARHGEACPAVAVARSRRSVAGGTCGLSGREPKSRSAPLPCRYRPGVILIGWIEHGVVWEARVVAAAARAAQRGRPRETCSISWSRRHPGSRRCPRRALRGRRFGEAERFVRSWSRCERRADFGGYARTMRYLESLDEVESVDVLTVVPGRLRLGLKLRTGGAAGLRGLLALGGDPGRGRGRGGRSNAGASAAAVIRQGERSPAGAAARQSPQPIPRQIPRQIPLHLPLAAGRRFGNFETPPENAELVDAVGASRSREPRRACSSWVTQVRESPICSKRPARRRAPGETEWRSRRCAIGARSTSMRSAGLAGAGSCASTTSMRSPATARGRRRCSPSSRNRSRGLRVCSSAPAPRRLRARFTLADLRSRLDAATLYRLRELDDESRAKALRRHAGGRGIEIPDDVVGYVLTRHGGTCRASSPCSIGSTTTRWRASAGSPCRSCGISSKRADPDIRFLQAIGGPRRCASVASRWPRAMHSRSSSHPPAACRRGRRRAKRRRACRRYGCASTPARGRAGRRSPCRGAAAAASSTAASFPVRRASRPTT